MIAFISGGLAGVFHVLSGPDHLAALAPLAVQGRHGAWREGIRWGLGHSAGVAIVGIALLVLRDSLPIERLSAGSERLVGVLLIGIGAWTWRQASRIKLHRHSHSHDGVVHEHLHLHDRSHPEPAHRHAHAALGIGTLHGLAGSSHLLGVLPSLAFRHTADSVAYLSGFCLGTIFAMGGFASALGWVALSFAGRGPTLYRGLLTISAVFAVGIGGWWLWDGPTGV